MTTPPASENDERRIEGKERRVTPWLRLDSAFMADEKTIDLGELHGPAGPIVFITLMCAAKAQDEDGLTKMGWRQLARAAFIKRDDAEAIMDTCEALGLVTIRVRDAHRFTAEIVNWCSYQRPADPTATARKRRQRERAKPDVTPMSRVTDRDIAGTPDLSRDDRDKDKDTDNDKGIPQQQRVAPAAEPHPAFEEIMQIAQEACARDGRMAAPYDASMLTTLTAYPDADHLRAANLAAADVSAGLARQPHFHKILAFKLADQAKRDSPRVVAMSEKQQREAEDLAALRSLRETRDVA